MFVGGELLWVPKMGNAPIESGELLVKMITLLMIMIHITLPS